MNPLAHLTTTDAIVIVYIAVALAIGAFIGACAVLLARDARPDAMAEPIGEWTRDPRNLGE